MPSPPGDEDEDFILVHHSDVQISEKAEEVYSQLAKILKEQYEVGTEPQEAHSSVVVTLLDNVLELFKDIHVLFNVRFPFTFLF